MEGDIVPVNVDEDKVMNKEDVDDEEIIMSTGDYLYEINEGEDVGAKNISFTANQLESDQSAPDNGMKTISIQFTFEVLAVEVHEMRPKHNFTLLVGDETYRPENVNILESVGLEENRWLYGGQDGKMEAIIEFIVPDDVENFELLFASKFLGNGILVKFE